MDKFLSVKWNQNIKECVTYKREEVKADWMFLHLCSPKIPSNTYLFSKYESWGDTKKGIFTTNPNECPITTWSIHSYIWYPLSTCYILEVYKERSDRSYKIYVGKRQTSEMKCITNQDKLFLSVWKMYMTFKTNG